jgi:cytoskeletal protein CcmA (bactofilin family)
MYRELLDLLEKRYDNGEIDKKSYVELKERYNSKLDKVREDIELLKDAPEIRVSGSKVISEDSVTVAGSATIAGGKVMRDIRISGSGKINGDVECNALKCSGAVKSFGNIIAHGDIRCSGSFKCEQNIQGDKNATFSGSAKIFGELVINGKLSASGSYKSEKNTQADSGISLSGASSIYGNLLSQNTIKIAGKATIEKNILCENLIVEGRRTVFESWFFRKRKKLVRVMGSIVAQNEIDVQDIVVEKNIKGRIVKLGPNTSVQGKIFYVEDLFLSEGVSLEKEPVKIGEEDLKL